MMIGFLRDVFKEHKDDDAIIWQNKVYKYSWLLEQTKIWRNIIQSNDIRSGMVISIESDFSPNGVALFLALIDNRCMLVPLTKSVETKKDEFKDIAEVEISISIDEKDTYNIIRHNREANHVFYKTLRQCENPGLVLFSSGSTGKSKAAVHDFSGLLEKFKNRRKKQRSISFLLYDHIGGVNTMLHTLSNGSCLITVQNRSPYNVLKSIQEYKAELLPTSPTFLNLILLSEAYKRFDLSSLKIVTYGTEPMLDSTLKRFHELFPEITLKQTYGLSEIGIMRSKSKSSDSLWMKIGGEGFETRIVDGILQIKAKSAMMGYLNAPSPFTDDGWFDTGDSIDIDADFIRILGRKSEIINVGGEKVYPAEVESVIQEMENVSDVSVYGEKNPIIGNIVCARVTLINHEGVKDFTVRLKQYCHKRLQRYKIPVKVAIIKR